MSEQTLLRDNLRQMVAVLEGERQALAGLDLDGIMGAAVGKNSLCGALEEVDPQLVDEECRGLLDAARRLNEVNRQVRNLIAANVSARLDMLTGSA
ncbi:MAG: flagellar protein FlgN, partial [Novosphingobium sp.]